MLQVDWYYDFISPFAYLASQRLDELPDHIELRHKPVLFAGLLNHFEIKGPAEIERMRQYTFRHVTWLAQERVIPLCLPPQHPFNPLVYLRLALALDCDPDAVDGIFRFIWAQGLSCEDAAGAQQLADELGLTSIEDKVQVPAVKQQLIDNTQAAARAGVFGVPTFVVNDELFFGQDSLPFLRAYLDDPAVLQSAQMRAADGLPEGVNRLA
ncbi:MAG TPA: 2-hydroxychromene-2-carboxylate isomerase [Gammaproteobacteria bacterium]|nr:2-hydroxychromene-2-carboxylate isomerase [Gammaproteobacteria bacterium]